MPIFRKWDGTDWEIVGGLGNPGTPQPPVGFSAHRNGVNQTGLASGGLTKVIFGTTDWNIGNVYDPSLSRFQPSTEGLYLIESDVRFVGMTACTIFAQIQKNGTPIEQFVTNESAGDNSLKLSKLVRLNGSTDYIEILAGHFSGSAKAINGSSYDTYFQASLIPGSYPVGGLTAITRSMQAPSSPADGDLWLDESVQVQDNTNYIDVTNASADYPLRRGETAVVNYSAATSVPLHIKTVEGLYELEIIGDSSVAPTVDDNVYLNPNNSTYSNAISHTYSSQIAGVQTLGSVARSAFAVGNQTLVKAHIHITTNTKAKVIQCTDSAIRASNNYWKRNTSAIWLDTTTIWSSLGTIIFPFAQSGTIIIRRIY